MRSEACGPSAHYVSRDQQPTAVFCRNAHVPSIIHGPHAAWVAELGAMGAGPMGGKAVCGTGTSQGQAVAICEWIDSDSFAPRWNAPARKEDFGRREGTQLVPQL